MIKLGELTIICGNNNTGKTELFLEVKKKMLKANVNIIDTLDTFILRSSKKISNIKLDEYKGNMLMVEEPETHLHSNNQILVGRLMALLVNAGIKVVITTYSDYIIREINNCIMLNNLKSEHIKSLTIKPISKELSGYAEIYKLDPKKVKAYLAENIKGKRTLKPMKITSNQGIFAKTFDEPISFQNTAQGTIFDKILEVINEKEINNEHKLHKRRKQ